MGQNQSHVYKKIERHCQHKWMGNAPGNASKSYDTLWCIPSSIIQELTDEASKHFLVQISDDKWRRVGEALWCPGGIGGILYALSESTSNVKRIFQIRSVVSKIITTDILGYDLVNQIKLIANHIAMNWNTNYTEPNDFMKELHTLAKDLHNHLASFVEVIQKDKFIVSNFEAMRSFIRCCNVLEKIYHSVCLSKLSSTEEISSNVVEIINMMDRAKEIYKKVIKQNMIFCKYTDNEVILEIGEQPITHYYVRDNVFKKKWEFPTAWCINDNIEKEWQVKLQTLRVAIFENMFGTLHDNLYDD